MSLVELQQLQHQRFPGRPRRQSSPRSEESTSDKVEVDINAITKYFDMPQLIEPIMDLNIDMLLFGISESDEDDEDDEPVEERNLDYVVPETNNTQIVGPANVDLDDDMCSSNLTVCENNINTHESASSSMLSDLFGISSSSDSEDENFPSSEPSTKKIKLSELVENYESPASPPPCEEVLTENVPRAIPLETICKVEETAFNQILATVKRRAGPRKHLSTPIDKANPHSYYKAFKSITHLLESPICTEERLVECTTQLLHISRSSKLLATCILELTEDIDQELDTTLSPPAPALTDAHKRLVLLIKRLYLFLPGFPTYCELLIERTMFTMSKNHMNLSALINLARLFIALHDLRPMADTSRIRIFIYKCLYYFQHRATPIVYAAIMAHPDCLPLLPESEHGNPFPVAKFVEFDPLVQTIYTILMNLPTVEDSKKTLSDTTSHLYKRHEIVVLLSSYFRYKGTRHKFYDLVQHLLERIRENQLDNVEYSLVLVAKRNGCQWAKQHLLEPTALPKLLRQLVQSSSAATNNEHDEQIACVLFVIAAVVKTMPVTEPVSGFHDLFTWVLDNTAKDRQVIQEAAIGALLMTARFGMTDVFNRIRHWTPDFRISRKLNTQLQTFIGRKPIAFWT